MELGCGGELPATCPRDHSQGKRQNVWCHFQLVNYFISRFPAPNPLRRLGNASRGGGDGCTGDFFNLQEGWNILLPSQSALQTLPRVGCSPQPRRGAGSTGRTGSTGRPACRGGVCVSVGRVGSDPSPRELLPAPHGEIRPDTGSPRPESPPRALGDTSWISPEPGTEPGSASPGGKGV